MTKYITVLVVAIVLIGCNSNSNQKKHLSGDTGYNMVIDFLPKSITEKQQVQFTLTPLKGDSVTQLEVQHEKKIHLIVVSNDLASFKHLHPVEQVNGSYVITDSFSYGGKYLLYADYKAVGTEKKVIVKEVEVNGNKKSEEKFNVQRLQADVNGFTVQLNSDNAEIKSGSEIMFSAVIKQGNSTLMPDSLQNYLGEKAHMVIIGVDNKKYLHVHPMVMGNELMLHTTFPEAGTYRAWLEFKKNNIVNVSDFVIQVADGGKGKSTSEHKH